MDEYEKKMFLLAVIVTLLSIMSYLIRQINNILGLILFSATVLYMFIMVYYFGLKYSIHNKKGKK